VGGQGSAENGFSTNGMEMRARTAAAAEEQELENEVHANVKSSFLGAIIQNLDGK